VQKIAEALSNVTEDQFRQDYFRIDPDDYGRDVDEDDYGYTWSWFQGIRDLYDRAAKANRYVLFTASQ
jgi:hypothetical protein